MALSWVVERSPFSIDDHLASGLIVFTFNRLLNVGNLFNVSTVGAGAKDGSEDRAVFSSRSVGSGHQSPDCVVDESGHSNGQLENIDLPLEQGADVLANGIGNVKALGPSDEFTFVDAELLNGETESEAEAEDVFVSVPLRSAGGGTAASMVLETVGMVLFEEFLNLLGQEGKQFLRGFRHHELLGNWHLVEVQAESGIAIQHDGADTKIGAAKVNS